jgi:predicted exporter
METWIGAALVLNALAVFLLTAAGLYLGSVLSRVSDAIEALSPVPKPRPGGEVLRGSEFRYPSVRP